ncbi:MAG: pantoate--beta-alanine ligase [Clostridiales bacterium]|nr:pantoate--beta-alanine ligase [Clostridiales bacterium]
MRIIHSVREMREQAREWRKEGRGAALVPTMGFLHEGHLSLARLAREAAEVVVMSIFVNPAQFGPREDFAAYPKDWERDCRLAESCGVDCLFAPSAAEMYPEGYNTFVEVGGLDKYLCGASRPGHFRGVATVVNKLFNIVQPQAAVFGQKDGQQAAVLQKITEDLNLPVRIIIAPIVREADGLAMSSRNVYLNAEERKQAVCLFQALSLGKSMIEAGERDADLVRRAMREKILEAPLAKIDYVEVVHEKELFPLRSIDAPAMLAAAVFFGKARLIDNVTVRPVSRAK